MSDLMFGEEVKYLMENSLSASLNILLEKKEDADDDFSFKDEKKTSKDSEGDSEGEGKEEDDDSFGDSGDAGDDESGGEEAEDSVDSGEEAEGVKEKQIQDLSDNLTKLQDMLKSTSDSGNDILQVQNYLSGQILTLGSEVGESVKESKSYGIFKKNKISYFLNEKTDLKQIQDDIEIVDNIIDKGSELIDKFKKGKKLNIDHYVEASVNAFRNFDNLFAKENIVKQAAINLIILNAGARAEENIKEYEELFHEELHKQFNIDYEEHAIINEPYHTATGAMKQG